MIKPVLGLAASIGYRKRPISLDNSGRSSCFKRGRAAMDPIHIPTTITPRELNSTNPYYFGSESDIGDMFPSFSFSSLAWEAAKYAYETGKHYTSEAYKYATKEINQFI